MLKAIGQALLVLVVCGAALALAVATDPATAGGGKDKGTDKGKDTSKDTPKDTKKVDPKPDAAKVKIQKEKAEQHYKDAFEIDNPPTFESAHFILCGQGRNLSVIAGDLERAYTKATKMLKLPEPGPWPGKLTVFLLPDSKSYPKMIRVIERRKADDDEHGSIQTEGQLPHVCVCPSKVPGDLGVDASACIYMCEFLLEARAKTKLPEWLLEGFGRATTLHILGSTVLERDRRAASAILNAKNANKSANDVFNNSLKAEENPYLRASLVDYMVYSGRTDKFIPFLEGFRDDEKGNPGNINSALANAKLMEADLTKNWHNYAKAFK
jgi:hypothetical protein